MAENLYLNLKDNIEATKVWNNFILTVIAEHGQYYTWDHVNTALADYNAKYQLVLDKRGDYAKKHYIRFGTPNDLTAFLMRYS